jgi:hypothetical protein
LDMIKKFSFIILAIIMLMIMGCAPTRLTPDASTNPPNGTVVGSSTNTAQAAGPVVPFPVFGVPDQSIPEGIVPSSISSGYTIFTWNNLGMHCDMSDYSRFLILPPYNTYWAQVVARSGEDPHIVNSLQVNYSVPSVTQPEKNSNFWQFASAYGFQLEPGVGLTGKKTSGQMDNKGDYYIAVGVPVIDISDSGIWDPYPFYKVQAVDSGGTVVAENFNVSPVSSEMRCNLCHTGSTASEMEDNILRAHDTLSGTDLMTQVSNGKLVLCASCHADPAMGITENKDSKYSLSAAMHTFHAGKDANRTNLGTNYCQVCHPGDKTQCLRDVMFNAGITCTNCHGSMEEVGSSDRTAWVNLPRCSSCHGPNLDSQKIKIIENPNTKLTASESELYRNSKAHGGGGIYCAACHGSPHAIYPTVTDRDNQYSIFLQGYPGLINNCILCHTSQPDESFWHFGGN